VGLRAASTGSERFTVLIQGHWLWLGGGWRKDAGMSLRRYSDDFRGRHVDLGIGTREMAAVVGVGLGRLLTMENGKATDEDKAFYRAWLSRIEGWSTAERHRQMRRVNQGISFRD
jgi:hypothetical protein